MNGCSKRIGSPEPRCIGARSVMLPDTKGDTGGTASASATVCPVIVSTVNVNGIRAAIKMRSSENQGLLPWLDATTADVVCLQETRADDEQLAAALAPALSDGWHLASDGGDLKGRNGVAVLSRHPIKSVRDLGADEFALHGRYVEVDLNIGTDGLTVASVYVQTGEAGTDRQLEKERFMSALAHRMAILTDRDAVVCGDWNIAHTENDIKNWKGNVKLLPCYWPCSPAYMQCADISHADSYRARTRPVSWRVRG
jgi:exodeoxyribonuclease III